MSDNTPGAPKEPQIPKSSSSRISFSYNDLIFDEAFEIDNRKYLRFFINKEEAFYIEVLQIEYLQYQQIFFDTYSKNNKEDSVIIDEASPEYEFLNDISIEIKLFNVETEKEEAKETIAIPVYYVYDLPEGLKFTIENSNFPTLNLN